MVWGSGESAWVWDVLVFRFLGYDRWKHALATVRAVPATTHGFQPVPASHMVLHWSWDPAESQDPSVRYLALVYGVLESARTFRKGTETRLLPVLTDCTLHRTAAQGTCLAGAALVHSMQMLRFVPSTSCLREKQPSPVHKTSHETQCTTHLHNRGIKLNRKHMGILKTILGKFDSWTYQIHQTKKRCNALT